MPASGRVTKRNEIVLSLNGGHSSPQVQGASSASNVQSPPYQEEGQALPKRRIPESSTKHRCGTGQPAPSRTSLLPGPALACCRGCRQFSLMQGSHQVRPRTDFYRLQVRTGPPGSECPACRGPTPMLLLLDTRHARQRGRGERDAEDVGGDERAAGPPICTCL